MGAIVPRRPIEEADRMLAQNYEGACIFTKKALAIVGVGDDIVAVRHDLPHMPSLGVSSLDSRPPCRHGGLLFFAVDALGKATIEHARGRRLSRSGAGRCFAPTIPEDLSRQTNDAAADALLVGRRRAVE